MANVLKYVAMGWWCLPVVMTAIKFQEMVVVLIVRSRKVTFAS